tara:strand:+ start:176 stop:856 length:681 start_codon:yes stop_codon:yes gene_type:complete
MIVSPFENQCRRVFNRITEEDKGDLVGDTQNTDQNSGQTFERFCLDRLIDEFNLKEMKDLSLREKRKISPHATEKCTVYEGICKDGQIVRVIDLPKSTPDFIIIYYNENEPSVILFIECKSIFSGSKVPKMNAGLNNPSKVHKTLYLVYKKNDNNSIIIRHGTQILSEKDAIKIKELDFLIKKAKEINSTFDSIKFEPARRFEFTDPDEWVYSDEKEKEALDIFFP